MSSVGFSFFAEPANVIKALAARTPELHFDYDEIIHEAHSRAFTVAKITRIDLLSDIQASLSEAYTKGQGFGEWRDNIKPVLAKKGWLGDVSVTNPKTGETKQIYVGSRRLKRIFETNMRVSVAKARYESQMSSAGEYFRYKAVLDRRTRPSHAKLHGMILPKTHKFWEKNYPPNDWGCRCQVQVLTQSEMQSYGFKPYAGTPLNVASKDWAYNPGKSTQSLDNVLAQKAKNLSGELKNIVKNDLKNYEQDRNLYVWQKGLDDMVDTLLGGDIIKEKLRQIVQVGQIKPNIENGLKKLGVKLGANSVALYQNRVWHLKRDSKPKDKEPNADEIKAIVDVLDKARHCYYNPQENALYYFYPTMQNDNMVNYALIRLNYTLAKFRTDNFVISIDKIPFENFNTTIRDKKRYKKIR